MQLKSSQVEMFLGNSPLEWQGNDCVSSEVESGSGEGWPQKLQIWEGVGGCGGEGGPPSTSEDNVCTVHLLREGVAKRRQFGEVFRRVGPNTSAFRTLVGSERVSFPKVMAPAIAQRQSNTPKNVRHTYFRSFDKCKCRVFDWSVCWILF